MDSSRQVRRIKLNGARFEGGRLPVDTLVELERYQQMLRILARAEWQTTRPGEAIPDGFDDDLSLTIEKIEPGSADIMLAFEQQAVYAEYQAQAQDALDGVIAAAYAGEKLPDLPPTIVQDLRDRIIEFGNTLEPAQSIEIFPVGSGQPVAVTPESRKQVVDQFALEDFVAEPSEAPLGELVTHPDTVVGRITEVDAEKGTYRFESLQHGRLIGHYDIESDMIASIRAAVDSVADGPVLRVEGDLQYDRKGKPWRLTKTHLIEEFAAGHEAWASRLIEMAELPNGWGDEGTGKVVAFPALDAANKIMAVLVAGSVEVPAMFATDDGGVILEWASLDVVRSIEATPDSTFELFSKPAGAAGALRTTSNLDEAIAFARGEQA